MCLGVRRGGGQAVAAVVALVLALFFLLIVPPQALPVLCAYPRLDGKVYVLTGASSGIGRGLAAHFASRGAGLVLVARRRDELEETVRLCGNRTRVVPLVGDAAEPWVTDKLRDVVRDEFAGRVDALVLNHAYQEPVLMQEKTAEEYEAHLRKVLDINYFSIVRMTLAFREALERTSGRVVAMGSTGQFLPPLFMSTYGQGKCALDAFFDHLYLEQKILNRSIRPQYFIIGEILTDKLKELSKQESERALSVESGVEQIACLMERNITRAFVPFYLTAPLQAFARILQPIWPTLIEFGWVSPNPDFVARVRAASS